MLTFYQAIQGWHNTPLDYFFILLSFLGSVPVYILLLMVLYWNVDKRFGFRLTVLMLFSLAFNSFLKDTFRFARPIGQPGIRSIYLSSAGGYSFPSGHSQGAATFYPYLWRRRPSRALKYTGVAAILLIGFSRLYLGVHWPQDVLAAYLTGFILVWAFQQIDQRLFKLAWPLAAKLSLSILLPLIFLVIYHAKEGWQLVGFAIGFTFGHFLEDRFLDYRERTGRWISAMKTLLGLIILGIWALPWLPIMKVYEGIYLPVLAVGGLWASFGAPYLFRRLGWERPQEAHTDTAQETS